MPSVVLVRKMLFLGLTMDAEVLYDPSPSVVGAENWVALGAGTVLLLVGASRRSTVDACLAVASAPMLYRGITGRWPDVLNRSQHGSTGRLSVATGAFTSGSPFDWTCRSMTATVSGVGSKICRSS